MMYSSLLEPALTNQGLTRGKFKLGNLPTMATDNGPQGVSLESSAMPHPTSTHVAG